jgi:hypothetical protein
MNISTSYKRSRVYITIGISVKVSKATCAIMVGPKDPSSSFNNNNYISHTSFSLLAPPRVPLALILAELAEQDILGGAHSAGNTDYYTGITIESLDTLIKIAERTTSCLSALSNSKYSIKRVPLGEIEKNRQRFRIPINEYAAVIVDDTWRNNNCSIHKFYP